VAKTFVKTLSYTVFSLRPAVAAKDLIFNEDYAEIADAASMSARYARFLERIGDGLVFAGIPEIPI
jgi:hypothetical protein